MKGEDETIATTVQETTIEVLAEPTPVIEPITDLPPNLIVEEILATPIVETPTIAVAPHVPEPTAPVTVPEIIVKEPMNPPPVQDPASASVPKSAPVESATPPQTVPNSTLVEPTEAHPLEPVQAAPSIPTPEPPSGMPQRVLDLTPAELDAARRLWANQNITTVQAKSARDRHKKREALLAKIQKYVKSYAPTSLNSIAYENNISKRKASDYMRILVSSGRVQAIGKTTSRTYS